MAERTPRGPAHFRQRDLEAALKALKAAGTVVERIEIGAAGITCWQCFGNGRLAGCFEGCCVGADCDPEDPDFCCAPSRCDVCKGKGGWEPTP